jgi:hypothetical protein
MLVADVTVCCDDVMSCSGPLLLVRHAALVAAVGWSTLGSAQAADLSPPPLNGNSTDWLCRGLPLPNPWGAPGTGATAAAPAKKCAATIYLGIENDTSQSNMFGLKSFVPPYAYRFGDSYFVGGSLSRVLAELGPFVSYEVETGVGQRFGSLREEEVWVALYARWKYFPWNDYVRTSVAASTGLNYASAIPNYEVFWSGNNQGSRLLHYFSPELTFGLPSMPDTDLVIRSHHRSGGGQFFGDNFPVYGPLFHGIDGGVQYLTGGIRQHF